MRTMSEKGVVMASPAMRVLTADEVARATADLIFALQKAFPDAELVPCESIEGETIHLELRLPGDEAVRQAAQDRAIELKQAIEDRYGIFILVRVVASNDA